MPLLVRCHVVYYSVKYQLIYCLSPRTLNAEYTLNVHSTVKRSLFNWFVMGNGSRKCLNRVLTFIRWATKRPASIIVEKMAVSVILLLELVFLLVVT